MAIATAAATAQAAPITLIGPSATFGANANAAAPTGATGGTYGFGPGGAVGGLTSGLITFTDPSPEMLTISIQDCCIVGDVYEAVLDGTSLGTTSAVPLYGSTLSTGTFSLFAGAGSHTLGIADIPLSYIGYADPYGGGTVLSSLSPAGVDVTVTSTPVPEPSSASLLSSGLFGLFLLAGWETHRRRKAGRGSGAEA